MLLDWSECEDRKRINRILAIKSDGVVLFDITDPNALPKFHSISEILDALERKECEPLSPLSSPQLLRSEESIPESHRQRRDRAWSVIKSIIESPNHGAFDPENRGKLIRDTMLRTGKNKDMIYRYLRKFWRHGATKNGLLPDFANCGAKGQLRIPGTKKRGRPNNTRRSLGIQDGINIGPDEQEKIRRGIKRFYHNPKLNPIVS